MTSSFVPPTLTSHIGHWLQQVSNHVSGELARKLTRHDISLAEWVVLRVLYNADVALPSALASQLGMTRGAITKLADRLSARGLVVRRDDPSDGRAQPLMLTRVGRLMVPHVAALADTNETEMFGFLSKAERSALSAVLEALVKHHGLDSVPIT